MILDLPYHQPVLLPKVISYLRICSGDKYIDATIGGGGYTKEIIKKGGQVLGIDIDKEAILYLKKKFKGNSQVILEEGNFADLEDIARKHRFNNVAGVIFDLGLSSFQLKYSKKGFSFRRDENLDMRMRERGKKAADLINQNTKEELDEIFSKYAEEVHSLAIASAIVGARKLKKIEKTSQLVAIIKGVVEKSYAFLPLWKRKKILEKTAAKVFQALRIAVNDELNNLRKGIEAAIQLLEKGRGRLAVLSYHSLEDRLVKLTFKKEERKGKLKIITRRPIRPSLKEIKQNFHAHSAKLRVAERTYVED